MFGDGFVPHWTGYTVGFTIVQDYLARHPDVPVEEWAFMEAEDILTGSGWEVSTSD